MNKIVKKIKEIISLEEPIVFAYLHGSFLEKEKYEDIDIGIYLNEKREKKIDILDYEIALSLKMEKKLNIAVDVRVINFAPLGFKYNVSCGLLLLSRDELKREDFLARIWDEYFDFLPMSEIYLKEVLNA
jgi:predicted nucleotidyltransferase